jgi:hypothetical protein
MPVGARPKEDKPNSQIAYDIVVARLLSLEEHILVLVPTLFLFVTIGWGYLFQRLILNELEEADQQHFQKVKMLLSPHFQQVTYSDAIFVFMVNGIVWILQLYKLALGVIVMVIGIVVAVTGLLTSFMTQFAFGKRISNLTMLVTLSVAAVEFAMFLLIP